MIKMGMPYSELINLDRKEELLRIMQRFSFADLERILRMISDSFGYLEQNINSKLVLSCLKADILR